MLLFLLMMAQDDYDQLKRNYEALQQEMQEFRSFYGTDKLRDLGTQLDDLKKTTRWTAYVQLSVSALTPLLTLCIALITYNATNHNEEEKAKVERAKLAADLYSKALADGSTPVLLNTANLTRTLLAQDPTFAKAMNNTLNTLAQRKSIIPAALPSSTLASSDSARRQQQEIRFAQLKQNVQLPTQAVGAVAKNIANEASQALGHARQKADSLAVQGYIKLLNGEAANAQSYFAKADFAAPGRSNYYELSRYLHQYRTTNRPADGPLTKLTPAQQQEIAKAILTKYKGVIPDSTRSRLAVQARIQP
ncbi:hypothetical protein [Hymenobacter sp. GOD-10R]|uniref:hypothetical protein n=1 Tax=Hymenobacter sp. GOD-10R TaxID=3093922 RepID=UPI002D79ED76|nr:hypothetical protein [Hymenobacter sp. GOD-10R]WRQ30398.1 hypothetical protein SD425_09005 [Hymenobacter sp. GOD-10R]